MTQLTVQLTQGQKDALLTEITDLDFWITNFVHERARNILERAKQSEHWTPAIVSLAQQGKEVDDWSVFSELKALGHVEYATDRVARENAEFKKKMEQSPPQSKEPTETQPTEESSNVDQTN